MVCDLSKRMIVDYDWRNMPVRFYIYSSITGTVTNLVLVLDFERSNRKLVDTTILMTYDAAGDRVKKEVYDHAASVAGISSKRHAAGEYLEISNADRSAVYGIDNTGNIETDKPTSNLSEDTPDAGALTISGLYGVQMAFSASEMSVYDMTTSSAGAIAGDLTGSYVRDNGDPSDIPQITMGEGGTGVKISGEAPDVAGAPISGVAYVDGTCVFVYDPDATPDPGYRLSYVTAAEGISRPDNTFEFYLKDHLGSTRMVMVASGSGWEVQEATNYLAYGLPITVKQATGDKKAREKFTGKEYDEGEGTGLGYWGARYYDNLTGSWVAVDPKEQDFNVYGYCAGNPVLKVDPDGESWAPIIIGAIMGGLRGALMDQDNAWEGFAKGAIIGAIGGTLSRFGGGSFINNFKYGMVEGAITGGLWSCAFGGNLAEGVSKGALWGTALAASQSFVEASINKVEGYGWTTNYGAFNSMVSDATSGGKVDPDKAQKALIFFKRRYGGPELTYTTMENVRTAVTDPSKYGEILIPGSVFLAGPDFVRYAAIHEAAHYYDIDWANKSFKHPGPEYGGDGVVAYNYAIENSSKAQVNRNVIMKGGLYNQEAWDKY